MVDRKKILVVVDRHDICEMLSLNLENEGYNVKGVFSMEEALKKLTPDCDLILIDIEAGDRQGFSLIQNHIEESGIPIIFLEELKPFIFRDIFECVKTALKIEKSDAIAKKLIKINGLSIDSSSKKVKIGNSIIPLTKIEFEILFLLASNPSTVYSRKQIADIVWKGKELVGWHTLDVHLSRLRKKLGSKAHHIYHRRSFGYEFSPH